MSSLSSLYSLALVFSSLFSSDSRFLNIMSSSLSEADMAYSWFSKWPISSDKLVCVASRCGLGSCNGSVDSKGMIIGSSWWYLLEVLVWVSYLCKIHRKISLFFGRDCWYMKLFMFLGSAWYALVSIHVVLSGIRASNLDKGCLLCVLECLFKVSFLGDLYLHSGQL